MRDWLFAEAEEGYRDFSRSLLPGVENVLGVRLPKLRKKAKELAGRDWRSFVSLCDNLFFEEKLLQGMVLGLVDLPLEEKLILVQEFVSKIDNWSICDSFCAGLKFTSQHREAVWEFLQPYLNSAKEFELRFGVVMILNFYVVDDWIEKVLDVLLVLNSEDYYAQMGIAWAISVCMVKYFDKTLQRLTPAHLHPVILKKSIQKGRESLCLTMEQKQILRELLSQKGQ